MPDPSAGLTGDLSADLTTDLTADGTPARLPDRSGTVVRDGVRLAYRVYEGPAGAAGGALSPAQASPGPVAPVPTVVLLPAWQIIDSRFWKAQIGFLARHYRVVSFDARGSGDSGRPQGAMAYRDVECARDVLAVMDATGTDRAVLVTLSCGARWAVHVAAEEPGRVLGLFAIAPSCGFGIPHPERDAVPWTAVPDPQDAAGECASGQCAPEGWAKDNRHYWLHGGYDDFREFFFGRMLPEPHSTKHLEDLLTWSAGSDAAGLADATAGNWGHDGVPCVPLEELCPRIRCPVTVVHGTADDVRPDANGERLAALTGGDLVLLEGAGHVPLARDPVVVNRLLREFVDRVAPRPVRRTWVRALRRPRRALYVSSPIGLGHARRDMAIARSLRKARPDLTVDWLAQDPVTRALADAGERVHPASAWLANESGHVEHEAGEHDLHVFEAIRRMDGIGVHNFLVFQDLVEEEHYDLVIADEAWEVDHFLHENPELKRTAYAWLTDFVGWLPMPDGGPREAGLVADRNAEMLEQRDRFRGLRDRSIFVGEPDDVVDVPFGPGLPGIRDWTTSAFAFGGYVLGADPGELADPDDPEARARLRARLGYRDDERICIVTAGGSAVGTELLRRVLDAVPFARRAMPELRFVVVAGPRVDPAALPRLAGAEVVGYLPDLQRHLAACDVAVVQGGLSTCMELTAHRRPFIYVPLRHHFEQTFHVPHRLRRYGAGRCMTYDEILDPEVLAGAVVRETGRPVAYRSVDPGGAARTAELLAELL